MSDRFDPYHVWLGIPPQEQPPNHYRLLGLRLFESSDDVISNALDQRLVYLRTLQTGSRAALSQKLLNEVSAAGVTLLDAKKKRDYDQQLRQIPEQAAFAVVGPRKSTLPTARPLEAPASAAVVVPIPQPPAEVVPVPFPVLPPPASDRPPTIVPGLSAEAPLSFSPAASSTSAPRGSGVVLALAVLAACVVGLAATVSIVVWHRRGGFETLEASLIDPAPSTPSAPDSGPPNPAEPAILPVTAPVPADASPGATVSTPPPAAMVTPAAPAPADPGEAWVYADNSRGGFRRVSADRWVELSSKESIWYRQLSATSDAIALDQLGGSPTTVKLLANRIERDNPELTGTTVFFGKWRSLAGLPPFARRDPGAEKPLPPVNTSATWHGLLFDGQSHLELPLPDELKRPGQPFTIEMWVRWVEPYQASCLWECGDLRLSTQPSSEGAGEAFLFESGGRQLNATAKIPPLRFHHLSISSDGEALFLGIDGAIHPQGKLPRPVSLGSSLRVGNSASVKQAGFRGALRGLRISDVNRYPGTTTTVTRPKFLVADDQTLVSIDLRAGPGEEVVLSGAVAGTGKRSGAQWVQLNYQGKLAAEPVPNRADLLRAFSARLHTLDGETYRTATRLDLKSSKGRTALLLPHLPPASYRVQANVTRTAGDGGLVLGLVLEREPVSILIDAAPGGTGTTGVLIPGDRLLPGRMPADTRRLFPTGTSQRLECDVLTPGPGTAIVRIRVEGKLAYEWHGPIASAPLPDHWKLPSRTMFIGSQDAAFSLTELTVTKAVMSPSGAVASTSGSIPAATAPAAPQPPAARHAPPDAATLAAQLEKARAIYEDELKKAVKPEQKAAVARNIAAAVHQTAGDLTARYVLLDLARKIFIQAGDVKESLALAESIEQEYQTPANEPLLTTLDALDALTLPSEERALLAARQIELAEQFFAVEHFSLAGRLADAAVQSANRQKDAALKRSVSARRARIVRIVRELEAVQAGLKLLETAPDDPAANLAAGKFYCFVLEKWERGVFHLAKCGDPVFSEPALAEKRMTDAASQVAAAEQWLAAATKAPDLSKEDKTAIQRRAKRLLSTAVSGLKGLDQVRAKKQLDELQHVPDEPEGSPPAAAGSQPRASDTVPDAVLAMAGSVLVNGRPASMYVLYRPGHRLTNEDFAEIAAAAGVDATGTTNLRIRFTGQVVGREACTVHMSHVVNPGANSVLTVNAQTKSELNPSTGRSANMAVRLTAGGRRLVEWEISARNDFDGAELAIVPTAGAEGCYELAPVNAPLVESIRAALKAGRIKVLSYPPGLLKQ